MENTTSTSSFATAVRELQWPLVLGLGALALIRPLVNVVEHQAGGELAGGSPVVPVGITLVVSAIWIAVAGLSRVRRPVLTLVAAGLVYAVLSVALSGILSPILSGQLQGPLAMPFTIIPVLLVNALWGLVCGAIALAVQRARGAGR